MPTVMAHNVGHSGIHKDLPYYANSIGSLSRRTLNRYASLTLALSLSAKRSRARWSLTSTQEASRRYVETDALDLSMGVLSYCAEQDSCSAEYLKTVNNFRTVLDAQHISGMTAGTPFSALRSDTSRSTPLSRTVSSGLSNTGQMPASAAMTAQPYSNTSIQANPSPPNLYYPSPQQGMAALGRSDTQSTNYSIPYDWIARDASGVQAADFRVEPNPISIETTTQHYQPFLQNLYRFEELSSMGYS